MRTFLLFVVVFLFFVVRGVSAEDASSATPSPSPSDAASLDSVKVRLNQNLDAKAQKLELLKQSARTRFETRKKEFQDKLKTVTDTKKKAILERMVNKFDALNTKWVEHWRAVLDRLTAILDKMDSRAQDLASGGVDITKFTASSKDTRTKIAAAQASLDAQISNTYVFNITTDSKIGTEAKLVTTAFKEDIQNTHLLVTAAQTATKASFEILKTLSATTTNE